jgi:TctA family transporter
LLLPVILLFCIVGSFAINNSAFGVLLMLGFGIVAYLMEENGFPVAPAILGMVLGAMLEENFISSMIKADGRLLAFFERPIAGGLGALTIVVLLVPVLRAWLRRGALAR